MERSSEEDTDGVVGGWKKCDLAPTFLLGLGGSMVSGAKMPDMAVCIDEVMFPHAGSVGVEGMATRGYQTSPHT